MDTNVIIGAGQVAFAIGSILTLGGIIVKWTILKPIKNYIDAATYPIQPHANGGDSLPDVIKALKRLDEKLDRHIESDHRK
jgi:hypothetical protein